MPEKLPDNMRKAYEQEAEALEARIAVTEDPERKAAYEANLKTVQGFLGAKKRGRPKKETRPVDDAGETREG